MMVLFLKIFTSAIEI